MKTIIFNPTKSREEYIDELTKIGDGGAELSKIAKDCGYRYASHLLVDVGKGTRKTFPLCKFVKLKIEGSEPHEKEVTLRSFQKYCRKKVDAIGVRNFIEKVGLSPPVFYRMLNIANGSSVQLPTIYKVLDELKITLVVNFNPYKRKKK